MHSPLTSSTLEKRKENKSAVQKVADWNSLRILDMFLKKDMNIEYGKAPVLNILKLYISILFKTISKLSITGFKLKKRLYFV